MNVTCAECGSVFRVDPTKIPQAGIRARCSVCGGVIAIGEHGAIDEDFVSPVLPRASAPQAGMQPGGQPSAGAAAASSAGAVAPGRSAMPASRPPSTLPTPPMLARTPGDADRRAASAPTAAKPAQAVPPRSPSAAAPQRTPPGPPRSMPPVPPGAPARPAPTAIPAKPAAAGSAPAGAPVPASAGSSAAAASVPRRAPAAPTTSRAPVPPTPPSSQSATNRPSMSTPSAGSAPATRPPINPFLANDPNQKAKRLARALISDIIAYFPDKHREGLQNGTLKELFREEIKKSYEEYVEQMGKDFATSTTHFQDALNEVLAKGQKVF